MAQAVYMDGGWGGRESDIEIEHRIRAGDHPHPMFIIFALRLRLLRDYVLQSEVDSANASGTQALTLRGLSNPGVLRLGVVYRETVSRYTVITPP